MAEVQEWRARDAAWWRGLTRKRRGEMAVSHVSCGIPNQQLRLPHPCPCVLCRDRACPERSRRGGHVDFVSSGTVGKSQSPEGVPHFSLRVREVGFQLGAYSRRSESAPPTVFKRETGKGTSSTRANATSKKNQHTFGQLGPKQVLCAVGQRVQAVSVKPPAICSSLVWSRSFNVIFFSASFCSFFI